MEQTTIILRYTEFDMPSKSWTIEERFIEFLENEKKTGVEIASFLCSVLEKHKVSLADCRAQGYDNGSNMAGIYKDVQAEILCKNTCALFSPCAAHCLNLCGVHAAEICSECGTYFGSIQKLYTLFSCSPARWKIVNEEMKITFKSQSQTRWSERLDAVKPVAKHLPSVIKALERVQAEINLTQDAKAEAKSLQLYFSSFPSILMSCIWFKILLSIDHVNRVLQQKQLSLSKSVQLGKQLVSDLRNLHDSWPKILHEATLIAINLTIPPEFPAQRIKKRKTMFDETPEEPLPPGDRLETLEETTFRRNVFYRVVDNLVEEMSKRSKSAEQIDNKFCVLWNFDQMDPESIHSKATNLLEFYKEDFSGKLLDQRDHLCSVGKTLLNLKDCTEPDPLNVLNTMYKENVENVFPQLCIGLRIFLTIPVSVATGERSFSKLSLIKIYLRSPMGQERLNSYLFCHLKMHWLPKLTTKELFLHLQRRKFESGSCGESWVACVHIFKF
ncbi:zinc finger MYM-type protein 1-like [Ambystoma mexicanum]|uniref:zinc finger MYM-type protein 1-like n=1 Tax=Ambystoma mexicanum TaxID=8296 RepID=UPI0037E76DEF